VTHGPLPHIGWPDDDRRSRIVFIVRDIPRERIEASLAAFNALANPAAAEPVPATQPHGAAGTSRPTP